MNASSTRLFPLLLMLALAALTFWLQQTVRVDQGVHPSLRRHDPDYVVNGLSHVRYDAAGRVESTLAASKMLHYPDDGSTELLAPRVVQTRPGEPRMTLTADRGTLSQDGEEVFLYDNVLLVRDAWEGRPETRMSTSFLHVVSARGIVRTDRAVLIQDADRRLSGRGMEYRNQTREFHLREQVRGSFAPRAK